jgi:hypothetical protein
MHAKDLYYRLILVVGSAGHGCRAESSSTRSARHQRGPRLGRRIAEQPKNVTATKLREAATGKALSEPMKHDDAVRSAQFSADGQRVVTASHDNTAGVWDIPTKLRRICQAEVRRLKAKHTPVTVKLYLSKYGARSAPNRPQPPRPAPKKDALRTAFLLPSSRSGRNPQPRVADGARPISFVWFLSSNPQRPQHRLRLSAAYLSHFLPIQRRLPPVWLKPSICFPGISRERPEERTALEKELAQAQEELRKLKRFKQQPKASIGPFGDCFIRICCQR